MKVSVIVLTYNSASTLRQALDSVLSQRCDFDYEVIVGDDASSDDTVDIIKEYASRYPYIRPVCAKNNRGVQANYFDCLEASKGEYIADCAGDDSWLETDRLQRMVDALENNPVAGLVFTDWRMLDVNTGCVSHCRPTPAHDCGPGELLVPLLACHGTPAVNLSASVYRKCTLMPYYYDSRDSIFRNRDYACEDLPVLFFLSSNAPALYLPLESLCYRVGNPGAVTSTDDYAKTTRFTESTLALRTYLRSMHRLDNHSILDAEAHLYAHLLGSAVRSGDRVLIKRAIEFSKRLKKIKATTRIRILFLKLKELLS